MSADAGDSFSSRFTPTVARVLAIGWSGVIAIIFLFRYDAWMQPVWFGHLCQAASPALHLGPNAGEFWWRRLLDAGWCVALLATAFAVGTVLIDRLVRERNLLTGLFALGVGLWATSAIVLAIGAVSVVKVGWVFLLAAGWLLPIPRSYFRRTGKSPGDSWGKLMVMFLVVAALLGLLSAMTPPFEYDELEYHLGAPSEYIKAGQIVFLPHNFYSNLPQLTEMLYLLGLVTRSDIAAKMLHWCFGVLSAVALYAVAARLWSRRIGLTAAALFYCLPFVQDLNQTARIDLATTFFATLAFGGALLAYDGNAWVWLSAWAAGAAVATKWTAIPVILVPSVAFVLVTRKSFFLATGYAFLVAAMVLPWLLKNWLVAGNPVYPLFTSSEHWTAQQAALFAVKHYPSFNGDGWREFGERLWRYSFTEGGASPGLLMTAPLILLMRGNGRLRRAGWLFVAVYVGWYLATFRPWRFLMPALPLAAVLGACALDSVGRWCRALVVVVMLVGLSWMGVQIMIDTEDKEHAPPQVSVLNLVLGQLPEQDFLARLGNGVFEPIVWMNEHLPAAAKVLYVGEARTHHARHAVAWATAFDQHPILRMDLTKLREAGITHVYVNFSEWRRLTANYDYLVDLDSNAFRHLVQDRARQIHAHGRNMVWELQ